MSFLNWSLSNWSKLIQKETWDKKEVRGWPIEVRGWPIEVRGLVNRSEEGKDPLLLLTKIRSWELSDNGGSVIRHALCRS